MGRHLSTAGIITLYAVGLHSTWARVGTTLVQGPSLQENEPLKGGTGPSNIIFTFSPRSQILLTNDKVINLTMQLV